ncbi:MAG: 4Fe-4S dicluster domain-containing protein, partial [Eggerthellaceae bacterium]|nr:4Fe-4S dicluster domain-containing protein [Eggerthellaceae bacterium]
MRYGFAIDTKRCIGCHTCSVACRIENNLPNGTWWNRALTDGGAEMDTPAGEFPDATMSYLTVACQHCENPACVKVCPVGATYKDPETGVVRQDYDKCIGCRMCMSACPYTGVRSFNWEE